MRRVMWASAAYLMAGAVIFYLLWILGGGDVVILAKPDKQLAALEKSSNDFYGAWRHLHIPPLTPEETQTLLAERPRLTILKNAAVARQERVNLLRFCMFLLILLIGIAIGLTNVIARHQFRKATVRSLRGQCIECGYDLRGSAERCPECGAAFERLPHLESRCV